jgi:hypothetical protein
MACIRSGGGGDRLDALTGQAQIATAYDALLKSYASQRVDCGQVVERVPDPIVDALELDGRPA